MDFNELVVEKIVPLVTREGFVISEMRNNFICFQSDLVVLSMWYNVLEKSSGFNLGLKGHLHVITEDAINEVFNTDLKVTNVTKEDFVNNLAAFFSNEGATLLKGNRLDDIDDQVRIQSEIYTNKIINDQSKMKIDEAWENSKYDGFIDLLDESNDDSLPTSYLLKYKIAKKRMS